ncbi:MAG: hypothetical protein K6T73_11355 [Candidatus Bathyarchaeota archaeon]|nr:hypothetical protein [Candidatus Bathyarchaeota archaeon]
MSKLEHAITHAQVEERDFAALEQIRTIEDLIKAIMPRIPYEAKAITVYARGWRRINFSAPFETKPVVIASLEGDVAAWYTPPVFPKITIKIPKVSVPTIAVPTLPPIDIPEVVIPRAPTALGRFECGWAVAGICDGLNKLVGTIEFVFGNINKIIDTLNARLASIRSSLISFGAKLIEFRDFLQSAINEQVASMNASLEEQRSRAEASINEAIKDAEKATSEAINSLWAMLGQESGKIFIIPKIRNVTSTGFEVYTPGACTIHYTALEVKVM